MQTFSVNFDDSVRMLGSSLCLLFFPVSISALNVIECSSNNTACDVHGDSLIDSFSGIETIGECRQLCYDDDECKFITYFGANGFPLGNFCEIFKKCEKTLSCSDCTSETKGCYKLCSKNIIGAINENFLEMIPDIESEDGCRDLCGDEPGCEYYTFYLEDDPYYGTCFLLSSLQPPIQDCPTCVTGPRNCDGPTDCSFLYDGTSQTHLMFTQPGVNITLSASRPFIAECQLRVLAVGGGGDGYESGGYYSIGGGGSGYIQYHTQPILSETVISLTVGGHGEGSTININNGDNLVASAGHRGRDGASGGAGYSGGGGGPGRCNGGSDGGDGECYGGSGTGEDITTYTLQNYQLSPGTGGQHYYDGIFYGGGGGGGVLVDGAGPSDDRTGQGYGGGGTLASGNSGVIILEIIAGN